MPIYTKRLIDYYKGKKKKKVPPHIYLVAENAYNEIKNNRQNQSLVLTGNSGSGKTENIKRIFEYFAYALPNKCGIKQNVIAFKIFDKLIKTML